MTRSWCWEAESGVKAPITAKATRKLMANSNSPSYTMAASRRQSLAEDSWGDIIEKFQNLAEYLITVSLPQSAAVCHKYMGNCLSYHLPAIEADQKDVNCSGERRMYAGERLNSITHLVGTVLSLFGAGVLLAVATLHHDGWRVAAFAVYCFTLILLYTFSTLYHSLQGRAKAIFQRLDHTAIYLLIAGTYTPFTLVTLHGTWGWAIFFTNWALALLGIAQEMWLGKKTRLLSLIIYVVMGWMVVVALRPLLHALPGMGMVLLGGGGVAYTLGIVFYVLDDRMPHAHGIWHLFVLTGSILQYLCILFFVA